MRDLFEAEEGMETLLRPGAVRLRGFATVAAPKLLVDLDAVLAASPWRHLVTPGGFRMSVAMTNCGALGWLSDRRGYRYDPIDPDTDQPWPALPTSFRELAATAAARVGFEGFEPDACLVNRYDPGARLSLHQDHDERDYRQPIVSVSLGLPAVFLFGGIARAEKAMRVPLAHGDVVVWGGPARLSHHGILPLKDGEHPLTGRCRVNLTFRKAG
ncbi:MAG: DNA oxidative demethylase AlkB [Variovorax sp.]